jgi:hypothetical protein
MSPLEEYQSGKVCAASELSGRPDEKRTPRVPSKRPTENYSHRARVHSKLAEQTEIAHTKNASLYSLVVVTQACITGYSLTPTMRMNVRIGM